MELDSRTTFGPAATAGGDAVDTAKTATAPVIDWTAGLTLPATAPVTTPSATNAAEAIARPAWLDDFVSGLGESDKERNPNVGLNIADAWSPAPKPESGLMEYKATVPLKRR